MLNSHLASILDSQRMSALGSGTTALNLYEFVVRKVAVLHNDTPIVTNEDLTDAQWVEFGTMPIWEQSQKHDLNVVGIRESFIQIDWEAGNHAGGGGLAVELVQPQTVQVKTLPSAPMVPVEIRKKVQRTLNGKTSTYWDVWSIEDPAKPFFKVLSYDGRRDRTSAFKLEGEYRFQDEAGPFLPWILYHAEATGQLWDYRGWHSLVSGTLDVGALVSYWLHAVADASWQQKFGLDVKLGGATTVDIDGKSTQRVSVDPTSVVLFHSDQDKSGMLGTLAAATDPQGLIMAIEAYIRMILSSVGIDSADIQSAQSGVAITLRNDTIRDFQASYIPGMTKGDLEYISKSTRLHNLYSKGTALPTTGYSIEYGTIALSHVEVINRTQVQKEELGLGLTSKVEILMRNRGITEDEAIALVAKFVAHAKL
jgi:hypothetical protein